MKIKEKLRSITDDSYIMAGLRDYNMCSGNNVKFISIHNFLNSQIVTSFVDTPGQPGYFESSFIFFDDVLLCTIGFDLDESILRLEELLEEFKIGLIKRPFVINGKLFPNTEDFSYSDKDIGIISRMWQEVNERTIRLHFSFFDFREFVGDSDEKINHRINLFSNEVLKQIEKLENE